jgi:hypothetical protein
MKQIKTITPRFPSRFQSNKVLVTKQDVIDAEEALKRFRNAYAKVNTLKVLTFLANIKSRWDDEKEYEDFDDYKAIVKRYVENQLGLEYVKTTKRPFGFWVKIPHANFKFLKVSAKIIGANITLKLEEI